MQNHYFLVKLKSFSLIEILVFFTIASIFFISAVSITVFFIKNSKTQQYKIIASHLLDEASEWIKEEKETDWLEFSSRANQNGIIYCLKNLNWNNQGNCQNYDLGNPTIFKREVILTKINETTIQTDINIYWLEGNGQNKISKKLILKIIE